MGGERPPVSDDTHKALRIRRVHFWYGIAGVVIFLLTGQYMHHVYDHLQDMPDAPRMLFRSAHIYFLLASILNLVMGLYFQPAEGRIWPRVQSVMSALLIVAPVLLLVGFFIEPFLSQLRRPYTDLGIEALFAAALLAAALGFRTR